MTLIGRSLLAVLVAAYWIALSGCADLSGENRRLEGMIASMGSKYAPDARTSVFRVTLSRTNKGIELSGEVDDRNAKAAVIGTVSPYVKRVTDNIRVLPDPSLGSRVWGIVDVSVANMRRDPDESTELVSQALLGTPVKLLRESGEWSYVQTPDRYLGWMRMESFVLCTRAELDAWITSPREIVLSTYGAVRVEPRSSSTPVTDVVAGALLRTSGSTGGWMRVSLPDGRQGFIPASSVSDYDVWKERTRATPEGIERIAKSLLGVPYLWGGTSTRALDCSGFTKTVYMLNGIQLSRDANQQAEQGVPVSPGAKFENLKKGDLLFFGRKGIDQRPGQILHVVMYLQDRTFIHASGKVKINSLDPSSPLFDPNKLRSFICARRVLPDRVVSADKTLHQ
ncbi:MAG TPA: NlpC/P60 family protein [Bacteroidota bacterium]|nr:NlpC/P60 family protein [Bacteroidota bacterium]